MCQVFVGTFFVFRNSVEKLCVSWAFSLVECVTVWAPKLPVSHTDVLKPTSRKVFLRNYWNPKEFAANICHSPITQNSTLLKLQSNFSRQGNSFPRFSTLWLLCLQVVFYFVQRFFRNLAYRVAFDGKIEINWRKWS